MTITKNERPRSALNSAEQYTMIGRRSTILIVAFVALAASGMAVDENDLMGKMVLVELPPGDYKFVGYIVTSIYFTGNVMRYVSAPGFEYKFDVVPGTINYVGDLNFTPTNSLGTHFRALDLGSPNAQAVTGTGATTFNFFAPPDFGMRFQVLDQQDRDAPLFHTQFPAYRQKEKV